MLAVHGIPRRTPCCQPALLHVSVSPPRCHLHTNTITVRNCTWLWVFTLPHVTLMIPPVHKHFHHQKLHLTHGCETLHPPCVTQTMWPAHKHRHCQKLHLAHGCQSIHFPVSPKQCNLHTKTITVRNCIWHMAVSLYTSLCHPNNATCTQTLSETAPGTWLSLYTSLACVTLTLSTVHKHCHCQIPQLIPGC